MGLAGQGGISWELWGDLGQLSRMTGARLLVGVLVAHRANGTRGGRNGESSEGSPGVGRCLLVCLGPQVSPALEQQLVL